MNDILIISREISQLRHEIYRLMEKGRSATDHNVLELSRRLDLLILDYLGRRGFRIDESKAS